MVTAACQIDPYKIYIVGVHFCWEYKCQMSIPFHCLLIHNNSKNLNYCTSQTIKYMSCQNSSSYMVVYHFKFNYEKKVEIYSTILENTVKPII